MKRVLRITGLVLLTVMVLLFVTLGILGLVYENQVKKIIVQYLNEQLDTKVDVQQIEFSFLKNFPSGSLSFKQLKIHGKPVDGYAQNTLVSADEIVLKFNVLELLKGQYQIKKLAIINGEIQLLKDASGKGNFFILKKDSLQKEKRTSAVELTLEDMQLNNCKVRWDDRQQNFISSFNLGQAQLSGAMWNQNFKVRCSIPAEHVFIQKNNNYLLKNKQVIITLSADKRYNEYLLEQADITVEKIHFALSGRYSLKEPNDEVMLAFEARKLDIGSLLSLLPPSLQAKSERFKSNGRFFINGKIKGPLGKNEFPEIKADFGIENGSIVPGNEKYALSKISMKGKFSNGMKRNSSSSYLQILSCNAEMPASKLNLHGRVDNFDSPFLDLYVDAQMALGEVFKFWGTDTLDMLEGQADVQLHIYAPAKLLKKGIYPRKQEGEISGEIELKEVAFKFKNDAVAWRGINGLLSADGDDINLQSLRFRYKESDIRLSGNLQHYLGLVNDSPEKARLWAYLVCHKFKLENWLPEATGGQSSEDQNPFLTDRILLKLTARIDEFTYQRFKAEQVSANIAFHESRFLFDSLHFNTMGGSVKGSGLVKISNGKGYALTCDANIKGVNITSLFYDLEDFSQQTLTSKQIKGTLNASVRYHSEWNNHHEILEPSIKANAELDIQNGELRDFKPLESLSKYVELQELKNIKFNNLQNHVSIADRTISIPEMAIKNNALNITCSGTHDFDNRIDYHFSVLLNDLLKSKLRKNKQDDSEFGMVMEDEDNKTPIFIHMTGTVDHPVFKLDKKAIKKQVKNEYRQEKETIKRLLQEEFGLFKKQDLKKTRETKSKSARFEIEWDENETPEPKKKAEQTLNSDTQKEQKPDEKVKSQRKGLFNTDQKKEKKQEKVETSDDYN